MKHVPTEQHIGEGVSVHSFHDTAVGMCTSSLPLIEPVTCSCWSESCRQRAMHMTQRENPLPMTIQKEDAENRDTTCR